MAPSRTMTGDTFMDEKQSQTPASPTNTDTSTLRGDAFIDIGEIHAPSSGSSSDVRPASAVEGAQPGK